ncbi:MAG: ferric reductase-like transmembrane domain-containing protein [Salinarimonas sp.]|nr:ferric reductase-like transmembrane domain-containing protein [Salinarimonas sp.]
MGDRPVTVRLWAGGLIALAILALALPFIVLLTGERPPAAEFLWAFSMGLGFGALALAAMQFALTGRLRWLTHPFGADIVYLCHRYLSWGALALMLGHFAILYIWYEPTLGVLNPLEARWELTSGRVALACFIALVISSQFRKLLSLPYEWWRYLHVALAVIGFAAAVAHVLGVGTYTAAADKRALWIGVTIGWVGLLAWSRIGRPLLQARNPWTVTANEEERGGVRTLKLAPQRRGLSHWKPGQFAWLSIGRSPWALKEHPFTISTPPEAGPDLSFSIKPLGDDTADLVKVPVGTRAYVDGPYGAFSIDREPDAPGFVMIAGGIGITPILANLEALDMRGDKRPVILFYANKNWSGISFRETLDGMGSRLALTIVHVLEDPPEGWDGETGFIDDDVLARHLPPESRDWPHLMCGPAPMLNAVNHALHTRGVPLSRIDTEVFDLV